MENIKWLIKKYGFYIVLIIMLTMMSIILGRKNSEKKAEEVWEPPVAVEREEIKTEDEEAEDSVGDLTKIPIEEALEPVSILTAEEEQNLRDEAMSAAEQCREFYKGMPISDSRADYSYIDNLSDEQRKKIVKCLGEQGLVSVSDDINMENYQEMEAFYSAYISGNDAMVTVYSIYKEGLIGALTFIHRGGKIQAYYVSIGWQEGGIPEIKDFGINDLEEIKLTEKGYFIYTYAETIMHGNMREYYRVKPLPDACREMTKKYLYALSYVNYNMLVTNWDSGNVEEILIPCMFEDIYWIYRTCTGEPVKIEGGLIPAEIYETVMTTFFPVSVEQLRENCGYHTGSDSYESEPIVPAQYPPFGEVVDYAQNPDGTITLYVDCVWPDFNTDCAYKNRIVVQPFEDGTFRYLSNFVEESGTIENITEEDVDADRTENGYDLPINNRERKEAEADCKKMMNLIWEPYRDADKGRASNVVISEEVMGQMADKLKSTGYPVTTTAVYSNMENYKELENFLNTSAAGISGSAVVYEIHSDGGMGRYKYFYDGKDMYVLSAKAAWSSDNKPVVPYISYTRMKKWRLTEKGWFCYELCVPEYPEVTEVMNGSRLFRVRPMTEENRRMSEKCVLGLGYQGNNLLCSNWDAEHMESLDYNGMYEYLYVMKYKERFPFEAYPKGIPKEEFEHLIMEYLPITAEELRNYAVFDEENQTYEWAELSCINYAPTYFGTSVPEVTHIKKNREGALTLTVDAVCDMILCDDAVITHELTVRFMGDGSFQYLGNKILDDGIKYIPDYQYRIYAE